MGLSFGGWGLVVERAVCRDPYGVVKSNLPTRQKATQFQIIEKKIEIKDTNKGHPEFFAFKICVEV